jgi:hypothetical protein
VEADAVVGGHDHERVFVQPKPAQPRNELAEQPIGQPQLEQVPLVRDLDQPRHAEPDHVVEPGDRLRREAPVRGARGVVLPRHVWQQDVLEPERRPRRLAHRARKAPEALDLPVREVARGRPGRRHAQARRAQPGRLLGHVQLVVVREQREEVGRMRVDVGAEAGTRIAAVEHRRHRERCAVVHGGGPAEPGRLASEPGERRVARGVDAPVRPEQRRERQLVEDHHHDRARRAHGMRLRAVRMLPRGRTLRLVGFDQHEAKTDRDDRQRRHPGARMENPLFRHENPAYLGLSRARHPASAAAGERPASG